MTRNARLVCVDYAQIEARVLAWLAKEDGLLAAFASGADVYSAFGTEHLYHRPISKATPAERDIAKMTVLGCGFGMSHTTFHRQCTARGLSIDEEQAKAAVAAYRRAYRRIGQFWSMMEAGCEILVGHRPSAVLYGIRVDGPSEWFGRRVSTVRLPSGRKIFYGYDKEKRMLYTSTRKYLRMWYGLLTENIVQATARDVIRDAMVRLVRRVRVRDYPWWLVPVTMTHDDLVFRIPAGTEDASVERICQAMREAPEWAAGLPLDVAVKIGDTYYDIK
jgi:DNA polymerase